MEKKNFPKVMVSVIALFSLIAVSCVNEKYDLSKDNINLEVTPFQSGVVIPIGSSAPIQLKDLLKDVDMEYLNVVEGNYVLSMSESLQLTEKLSQLKDLVSIPDVNVGRDLEFELNEFDPESLRIPQMDYSAGNVRLPDFDVPLNLPDIPIQPISFPAGLSSYVPAPDQLSFNVPAVSDRFAFASIPENLEIPEYMRNNNPITIDPKAGITIPGVDLSVATGFGPDDVPVRFKVKLPKGISRIEDLVLHEGASVKMSVSLINSFFNSGTIKPHIDIDIHEIFHLTDSENEGHDALTIDHITADFDLPAAGGTVTRTYGIKSLAIDADDWRYDTDGSLILDKNDYVHVEGSLNYENVTTTTNILADPAHHEMVILMSMEFENFQIDDLKMTVDPFNIKIAEQKKTISIPAAALPEFVESVENISFKDSYMDVKISADNLDRMKGLNVTLDELSLRFPQEIKVEGADADNKLLFEDLDLGSGINRRIRILSFTPSGSSMVNGQFSYSGDVTVSASATAQGTISSAALPKDEASDVKVKVEVLPRFEIDDYKVKISGYRYNGLEFKQEISTAALPENVADMGKVSVTPEEGTEITMTIGLPETGFSIISDPSDPLTVHFPDMVVLDMAQSSSYVYENSKLVFRGEIPSEVVLGVRRLDIIPVKDPVDGKYYAKGELSVSGGVAIDPCTISKEDVEALSGADLDIRVSIPEIAASTLSVNSFSSKISDKPIEFDLDILKGGDVPEELVAVNEILLDNAAINLEVDASQLPDLHDASLEMEFFVSLPDFIILSEDSDITTDGRLRVSGALSDKSIKFDPICIQALDLSKYTDLSKGISGKIAVEGNVTLKNVVMDVDQWLGRTLKAKLIGGLSNIVISKVTGKVDYQIDPVVETVDLSDLKTVFAEDGLEVEFDLYQYNLVLDVKTNLGVPVVADLQIVPYFDGVADETAAIRLPLALEASQTSDVVKNTRYWISNMPQDKCPEGYTYRYADILTLIKKLPEKLDIRLVAGTDAKAECVFEPQADYELTADYALTIPVAFGNKFEVTYKTKIDDLPEGLGMVLDKGTLGLTGTVVNGIPLGLDISFNLLDSKDNIIKLAEGCGRLRIAPATMDSATSSDLNILLGKKPGVDASDLKSIEVVVSVTSSDVAGVPFKEDSFLQVTLQAALPDGITIDLNDFSDNDDNK